MTLNDNITKNSAPAPLLFQEIQPIMHSGKLRVWVAKTHVENSMASGSPDMHQPN